MMVATSPIRPLSPVRPLRRRVRRDQAGLGSWLSSAFHHATGAHLSDVIAPIAGIVGTAVGGPLGGAVGSLVGGAVSGGGSQPTAAGAPTIAGTPTYAGGPSADPYQGAVDIIAALNTGELLRSVNTQQLAAAGAVNQKDQTLIYVGAAGAALAGLALVLSAVK